MKEVGRMESHLPERGHRRLGRLGGGCGGYLNYLQVQTSGVGGALGNLSVSGLKLGVQIREVLAGGGAS